MKPTLRIEIPEPCNVPWNSMTEVANGKRHCGSCDKVLTDFTQWSDEQLINYFTHNNGKLCGQFSKSQLDRAIEFKKKEAHLSSKLLFPFLFAGGFLQAQSTVSTEAKNNIVNVQEVHQNRTIQICGDVQIDFGDTARNEYGGLVEITNGRDTFFGFSRRGEYNITVNCRQSDTLIISFYETLYTDTILVKEISDHYQHDIILNKRLHIDPLSNSIIRRYKEMDIMVMGDLSIVTKREPFTKRVAEFFRRLFRNFSH
ncbi:MAG: hypothetical protein ACK5Z2_03670 [Bacteroidota bacterium]|jgi:hypothetical protein